MNCLKDYVGIRGYGTAPLSGQYVNQLPGISLKAIQNTANSEQVTFVALFDDIQDRAWNRLATDLKNKLRSRFKILNARTMIHIESGEASEHSVPSPHYLGLLLDSGIDNNGFFAFQVATILLDLPSAQGAVDIKIFDRTGHLLDTLTVASSAEGLNTIVVNKEYAASRIFIAVDASTLTTKLTPLGKDNYSQPFFFLLGRSPGISGGEAMLQTPAFVALTTNTAGLSAIVTPVCDYSNIVCSDKPAFVNAWMYLLGAELMVERMYSERVNKYTTVDRDQAAELRDLFTGQYENALDDIAQGLQVTAEDGCIECRETVSRIERLP